MIPELLLVYYILGTEAMPIFFSFLAVDGDKNGKCITCKIPYKPLPKSLLITQNVYSNT